MKEGDEFSWVFCLARPDSGVVGKGGGEGGMENSRSVFLMHARMMSRDARQLPGLGMAA